MYTPLQKEYIESVGGEAHQSAVQIIGELEERLSSLKPDYAYSTVEEVEKLMGITVNEAFRIGWTMARTTNAMLGI